MAWQEAGRRWGASPRNWAYLFEPYARPANELVFARTGVGPDVRVLDIACGSGFAATVAAQHGASVSGIDASEPLIAIARARNTSGDFRVGDMFDLPFADAAFDVATSFNEIWKGCEGALVEAHRVLIPGGLLGMTFWGAPARLGLLGYFATVFELSLPSHSSANLEHAVTGKPGVVEDMLEATGFEAVERGTVVVVAEWPDVETAVKAMAAAGPSVPAIESVGYNAFTDALTDVVTPMYDDALGVRISSEFGWITARAADRAPAAPG